MGRVIRGARFREERYTLEVPEIALPVAEPTILDQMTQIDGYDNVVDGCNMDDLGDHRPGRRRVAGVV